MPRLVWRTSWDDRYKSRTSDLGQRLPRPGVRAVSRRGPLPHPPDPPRPPAIWRPMEQSRTLSYPAYDARPRIAPPLLCLIQTEKPVTSLSADPTPASQQGCRRTFSCVGLAAAPGSPPLSTGPWLATGWLARFIHPLPGTFRPEEMVLHARWARGVRLGRGCGLSGLGGPLLVRSATAGVALDSCSILPWVRGSHRPEHRHTQLRGRVSPGRVVDRDHHPPVSAGDPQRTAEDLDRRFDGRIDGSGRRRSGRRWAPMFYR